MSIEIEARETQSLLERFGMHLPQPEKGTGIAAAIEGSYANAHGTFIITLTIDGKSVSRPWPLTQLQAQDLIAGLRQEGAKLPHAAAFVKMLAHLLVNFSRICGFANIERFRADLHLAPHDYTLDGVTFVRRRSEPPVKARLPKHRFTDTIRSSYR